MESNSTKVAKIATKMAICNRNEEDDLKRYYNEQGIKVTAVNIGGNINSSISKILRKCTSCSKKK